MTDRFTSAPQCIRDLHYHMQRTPDPVPHSITVPVLQLWENTRYERDTARAEIETLRSQVIALQGKLKTVERN